MPHDASRSHDIGGVGERTMQGHCYPKAARWDTKGIPSHCWHQAHAAVALVDLYSLLALRHTATVRLQLAVLLPGCQGRRSNSWTANVGCSHINLRCVWYAAGAVHAPLPEGLCQVFLTTQLLLLAERARSVSRCCRMFDFQDTMFGFYGAVACCATTLRCLSNVCELDLGVVTATTARCKLPLDR